jgi:hypothetical protein
MFCEILSGLHLDIMQNPESLLVISCWLITTAGYAPRHDTKAHTVYGKTSRKNNVNYYGREKRRYADTALLYGLPDIKR